MVGSDPALGDGEIGHFGINMSKVGVQVTWNLTQTAAPSSDAKTTCLEATNS